MKSLLAVGACYLDTILTVPHYPLEDSKLRATRLLHRRGGNCPNMLEVLQQLVDWHAPPPVSLVLCAVLPSRSSPATQQIKASLAPTVDLSRCVYREECAEAAASYVIRSGATGSRTIVNYNELPEMTSGEFVGAVDGLEAEMMGWCHFEGRIPDVTLECMRHLRRRFPAVRISVEVEKPGRAGLEELAAEADVVFYSKSWAQGNGYETPEACLRAQAALTPKASLLCCTWGDEGASALGLPSYTYVHNRAFVFETLPVIDTIGAGDTFIAGMLYGLTCHADDWRVEGKLAFANELAGWKVLQEGFSGLGEVMMHAP